MKNNIIKGGYWLKKPGPNPEVIIVYQGAVAIEAIESVANSYPGVRFLGSEKGPLLAEYN